MKKSLLFLGLSIILAFSLIGCDRLGFFTKTVEGSGEVVIEKRDLSGFNKIEANGDFELYVTQLNTGVEVHAESNLMKYIRTYVQDQTLFVEIADTDGSSINLMPLEPIRVYVRLVRIRGLSGSGGVFVTTSQLLAEGAELDIALSKKSNGYINAIRTGTLTVDLSGESDLRVRDGQVTEQFITAGDGSIYTADWLKSDTTEIKLSGGSEATIWAVDTFQVDLSDGSMAYYYGSPLNLNEVRNTGGSDYISRGNR